LNKVLFLAILLSFLGGLFVMELRHAKIADTKVNAENIITLREQLLKNDQEQLAQIAEINKNLEELRTTLETHDSGGM